MALLNFDGSPHGGSHKLLPEWNSQPKITPVLIIDHTIVGTALGAWWYFHDSTGVESHFIIRGRQSGSANGHIWQLMDTGRQADANLNANPIAISVEHEDNGFDPIEPKSAAQLESDEWLFDRLVKLHPGIKRVEATDCNGPGLGWHSKMQPTPSCWTPSAGKTCPGSARISQHKARLLPAFVSGTVDQGDEFDMADLADLEAVVRKVMFDITFPSEIRSNTFASKANATRDKADAIIAALQPTGESVAADILRRVSVTDELLTAVTSLQTEVAAIREQLGGPTPQ